MKISIFSKFNREGNQSVTFDHSGRANTELIRIFFLRNFFIIRDAHSYYHRWQKSIQARRLKMINSVIYKILSGYFTHTLSAKN